MTRLLALISALALGACTAAPLAERATPAGPPAPSMPLPSTAPAWRQHDVTRPQPPRVEPARPPLPAAAPGDAVMLIGADGSGLENWETDAGDPARWRTEGGALVVASGTGAIRTRESFGDVQLHVEWMPADEPDKSSQNRSNSGVFLADGRYEIQILDVWDNATYADGRAAALYGQFPPLADASRPPSEWQSYDVSFRMPRFAASGAVIDPARITVVHNGVLVQNNEALPGGTMWMETLPYVAHGAGRISLQDHGSPVRFRNLWVRRIPERAAPPAGYPGFARADVAIDPDRFVGTYDRENDGGTFVVERLGDGLGLSMPWRAGVLPMIPVSATEFELAHTYGRLRFDLDASGTARGFTMAMGGGTYPATRQESGR